MYMGLFPLWLVPEILEGEQQFILPKGELSFLEKLFPKFQHQNSDWRRFIRVCFFETEIFLMKFRKYT